VIFSHDLETDLVQEGLASPPHVCGSYATDEGSFILAEADCVPWFRERIARDRLVGLNYAFDLGVMCAADASLVRPVFAALEQKRVHDVGIREALIDIARGNLIEAGEDEMGIRYGMRELSRRYFAEDVREEKKGADSWRRRYATLRGVPVEKWPWAARRYVLRDAAKPLEIFRLQEGRPNLHDEFRQVRAAFAFQLMSMWGLRTSRPKVTALEAEVEAEWQATRRELEGAGIFRPDKKKGFVQDKKRTAELVSKAYGPATPFTAPSERFPAGQVATDRDTLLESGDPTLIKLGSAGKNDKRRSTYLPILRRGLNVPWNPQFNVLVATGRASGDAQQFPTGNRSKGGIREAFEPRPGFGFFSVDYEGLELRTMAQRAIWVLGYSRMAEVLNRRPRLPHHRRRVVHGMHVRGTDPSGEGEREGRRSVPAAREDLELRQGRRHGAGGDGLQRAHGEERRDDRALRRRSLLHPDRRRDPLRRRAGANEGAEEAEDDLRRVPRGRADARPRVAAGVA
jgi:DNA polymerase-1